MNPTKQETKQNKRKKEMKKLIFWAGLIITIGIVGNEDDSITLIATIGIIGTLMMLYGLDSVVGGHRIKDKDY